MAEELQVQANRVRDLIGDAHWLSDGHHKEYLLVGLLNRHLPAGMAAARGFVISPSEPAKVSTEQDILIVDTTHEPPVFNQAGMIVAFPRTVRAAVSVKTTLSSVTVRDCVNGLGTVRDVSDGQTDRRSIWCGAYYFESDSSVDLNPQLAFNQIRRAILESPAPRAVSLQTHPLPLGPDMHCSARDLAFKLVHGYAVDPESVVPARLMGYQCHGLATAVFLGELLDHIAVARGAAHTDFTRFCECGETRLFQEETLAPAADGR